MKLRLSLLLSLFAVLLTASTIYGQPAPEPVQSPVVDQSAALSHLTADQPIQIAAGANHTCALAAGGGVKCWGDNESGQLGDGTTTTRNIPVDVFGLSSGVSAIAAGGKHTCALMVGGGVKCWGFNSASQLGDGTTTNRSTPVDVSSLNSGVGAIAAGSEHTCALMVGGGVKCWGWNGHGQLGDGTNMSRPTPVDVNGLNSGVSAIATTSLHTCALMAEGGVKCWGRNFVGQLGDGTRTSRLTPVNVSGLSSGISAIATGTNHTCAVTTGDDVKCWGSNGRGQLGDGTSMDRLTPVDVSGLSSGISAVATGANHTCGLTLWGGLKCWGDNDSGQLGDGTRTSRSTPVDVSGLSSGISAISAANLHTCALTVGGGIKCWGFNNAGQLGDSASLQRHTPVDVSGLSSGISAIATGGSHTCALTVGGGVKCWGNNAGQLGDGTSTSHFTPVDVSGLSNGGSAIATGLSHTCALTVGGGVKCWGLNDYGQLGDGTSTDRLTPVDVSGLSSGVSAIATGNSHTCVLTVGGGVKCWGLNGYGQLGDGTITDRLTPVDVSGLSSGVSAIATGNSHTCVLTVGGGVKCWGRNGSGQLGDGTSMDRLTPVDVSGLNSGVSAIATGGSHTCALTVGGGVKCWGGNFVSQLGDGTISNRLTPVDVSGLNSGVSAIATGNSHTCALTVGGGVKCWGGNFVSQLGDGTSTQRSTPVDVSGLSSGVSAVMAALVHTCALTVGDGVKCWGYNGFGQLGVNPGWIPVDVLWPIETRPQILQNASFDVAEDPRVDNHWQWIKQDVAGADCFAWTYGANDAAGPPEDGERFLVTHRNNAENCLSFAQDVRYFPQVGDEYTFTLSARAPITGVVRNFDMQIHVQDAAGKLIQSSERRSFSVDQNQWQSFSADIVITAADAVTVRAEVYLMNVDDLNYNFDNARLYGPERYSISGQVTAGGQPLADIQVVTTVGNGVLNATKTNSAGNFQLSALPNGEYQVVATSLGRQFTPPMKSTTISGADVQLADSFVGNGGLQILQNRSFEDANPLKDGYWAWNNAVCSHATYTADHPYGPPSDGTRFLATTTGSSTSCLSFYQEVHTSPQLNSSYTYGIDVRASVPGIQRTVELQLHVLDANRNIVESSDRARYTIGSRDWVRVSNSLNVTKIGGKVVRAEIYLMDTDGVDYNFDNAELLVQGSTLTGVIKGDGNPLTNAVAKAILVNDTDVVYRSQPTAANGVYVLNLPPGHYFITAEANGFDFEEIGIDVPEQTTFDIHGLAVEVDEYIIERIWPESDSVVSKVMTAGYAYRHFRLVVNPAYQQGVVPVANATIYFSDSSSSVTDSQGRFSYATKMNQAPDTSKSVEVTGVDLQDGSRVTGITMQFEIRVLPRERVRRWEIHRSNSMSAGVIAFLKAESGSGVNIEFSKTNLGSETYDLENSIVGKIGGGFGANLYEKKLGVVTVTGPGAEVGASLEGELRYRKVFSSAEDVNEQAYQGLMILGGLLSDPMMLTGPGTPFLTAAARVYKQEIEAFVGETLRLDQYTTASGVSRFGNTELGGKAKVGLQFSDNDDKLSFPILDVSIASGSYESVALTGMKRSIQTGERSFFSEYVNEVSFDLPGLNLSILGLEVLEINAFKQVQEISQELIYNSENLKSLIIEVDSGSIVPDGLAYGTPMSGTKTRFIVGDEGFTSQLLDEAPNVRNLLHATRQDQRISGELVFGIDEIDDELSAIAQNASKIEYEIYQIDKVQLLDAEPLGGEIVGVQLEVGTNIDLVDSREFLIERGVIVDGQQYITEVYIDDSFVQNGTESFDTYLLRSIGALLGKVANKFTQATSVLNPGQNARLDTALSRNNKPIQMRLVIPPPSGGGAWSSSLSESTAPNDVSVVAWIPIASSDVLRAESSTTSVPEAGFAQGGVYSFSPVTLTLPVSASLSVVYMEAISEIPMPSALRILRWNPVLYNWEPVVATNDVESGTISAQIEELGAYSVGYEAAPPQIVLTEMVSDTIDVTKPFTVELDLIDSGVGVDPSSIRVVVNNRHIPHSYVPALGQLEFTLEPPYKQQIMEIEVHASDTLANAQAYAFEIVVVGEIVTDSRIYLPSIAR
ncbi:hypothetical protein GC175_13025 [bacterium]|nr:hypothetical protein [bacterium]